MLSSGTRLGPYEITSRIGAGGMGEVYKARDTRLDRTVAIKVLPPDLTTDPAAKRRFDREARAVAALSHPHICPLFDIGHHDGTDFLVMEYLDGETLAGRLARGKLPLDQALQYGTQIVDGLAAAHRAGIIHRDLKPGNIMLTQSGVKLLDFGLAKACEQVAVAGITEVTTDQPLTGAGMIVGTLQYMAPEQLQGKESDTRTDIFAVGAVLYEMLAGRRAFEGSSNAAIIGNILHTEPPALSLAEPAASPALERLVRKCLAKGPDQRWQSALDLNSELQWLTAVKQPTVGPGRRHRLSMGVMAAVVLVITATLAWQFSRSFGVHVPGAEVLPVTTLAGDEMRPALSPDGSQVAFFWGGEKSNDGGLYITMIGSPEFRRLTSPARDDFPRWSPDGRHIAFVRFVYAAYAGGRIHTVSPLGGPDPKLSDFPARGPLAWSPDGRHVAASRWAPEGSQEPTGIYLIPVAGGEPRPLTDTRAPFRDTGLAFSPDGRQLAYASCTPSCDVYISALDPAFTPVGPPKRLTAQALSIGVLAWTRDGKSVIFDSAAGRGLSYLSRVAIDGTRPPERIELAGLNAFAPTTTVSADRLAFSRSSGDFDVYRWESGRAPEPIVASSFPDEDPAFAPRSDRIAFASARSGRAAEIWVAGSDGSGAQRLLQGPGRWQSSPQWSPDGRRIAFDSVDTDGRFCVWTIDAQGGLPHRLTAQSGHQQSPTWSHDGRWIYYCLNEGREWDIWRVPAAGGTPERLTRTGNAAKGYESLDGKSLVYQARYSTGDTGWESSRDGPLLVVPLEGGRPAELVRCAVAGSLSVGPAGIYYGACQRGTPEVALHVINMDTGETHSLGTLDGFAPGHSVAVSPDGKKILYVRYTWMGVDVFLIENFR